MNRVSTSGIVLALALGVHSLFEGVAFGLMPTIEQMWELAMGIFIHKAAGVMSLGAKMAQDGASMKQMICYILIFSLTAPIGIVIGINIFKTSLVVDTVVLSISGGTFIYVACTEVIVQ